MTQRRAIPQSFIPFSSCIGKQKTHFGVCMCSEQLLIEIFLFLTLERPSFSLFCLNALMPSYLVSSFSHLMAATPLVN